MNSQGQNFALCTRPQAYQPPITAELRLLATTDIHMALLGFDYVTNSGSGHHGLAGIATLIDQARREARAEGRICVLLDNGDILQGSAMGNWLAKAPVTKDHPVVAGFNHLRYDAIGIGNHDLDHGLPYLRQVASHLKMPMIRSNLHAEDLSPLKESALINCQFSMPGDSDPGLLRIGLLSVLPADTAIWNRPALEGEAEVEDAVTCLRRSVPALREMGADLIVVLAHMGIGDAQDNEAANDSALALAQVPGIDAIITGHTHRRFPGLDHSDLAGVDSVGGTVAARPAIMPGFAGSDLAVLDLSLSQSDDGRWHVTRHKGCLRPNTAKTPPDKMIRKLTMPAHLATLDQLSQRVGYCATPLHNFFSLAMPTPTGALMAMSKGRVVKDNLANTRYADLPLLIATAAHTAGGRGGASNYLHIPEGPIYRRHIAGLNPYANNIRALEVTGADLKHHLERSALAFNQLEPGCPDQLLIDTAFPAFNFDTIFGLDYRIDPTQAAGQRIHSMMCNGAPVTPHCRFVLATNQFRAAGGGGFDKYLSQDILLCTETSIEEALTDTFANSECLTIDPAPAPWRFACDEKVQAILHTSPDAIDLLDQAAHLTPEYCGLTENGYARIRLTL